MRVLVLDDDDARHDRFRLWLIGADVDHVRTAAEARDCLRGERYDLVCLDRDLDLTATMGQDSDEETGEDVAFFIRLHLPSQKLPRHVLIHSWNVPGARRMAEDIEKVRVPFTVAPFGLGLGMTIAKLCARLAHP